MYRPNDFRRSTFKFWLTLVISLSLVATPAFTASRDRLRQPTKRAEQTAPASTAHSAAATALAQENYGKVPLGFEANQGQTDPRVQLITRAGRWWDSTFEAKRAVPA